MMMTFQNSKKPLNLFPALNPFNLKSPQPKIPRFPHIQPQTTRNSIINKSPNPKFVDNIKKKSSVDFLHNTREITDIAQQKAWIDIMTLKNKEQIAKQLHSLTEDPINMRSFSRKKDIDYDLDLALQIDAPYRYYKLDQNESQTIPIKITLKTREQLTDFDYLERPGVDLICLVDISSSMHGEKLSFVKKTLKYMISILKDSDRLSLIVFYNEAEIKISLKKVSDNNMKMFNDVFDSLESKGGTSIKNGMKLVIDMIKKRKYKNPITSIFILSDGIDNQGPSISDTIRKIIVSNKIQENCIINSFGFGKDHDANLMKEISKPFGGNFYFIDDLYKIDQSFVDAIALLFSVLLKNIEIFVKINNSAPLCEMKINRTYGDMWEKNNKSDVDKIFLKLFTLGMKKDYICEVVIPACKELLEEKDKKRIIVNAHMVAKSAKDEQITIEKIAELKLTFLNPNDQIKNLNFFIANVDVLLNRFRVRAAEKIEKAKKFADKNKFEKAQKVLKKIKKELDKSKFKDHPMIVVLIENIKYSMKMCKPHKYSNSTGSYMASYAVNNMYQQSDPTSSAVSSLYGTSTQMRMNTNLKKSKLCLQI